MTSLLDRFYASRSNRLLFFKEGWGDLARVRELFRAGRRNGPPAPIEVRWEGEKEENGVLFRHGAFASPYSAMPLPEESRDAYFELVLPRNGSRETPICIHFAATGDEGFARRRKALALPLLRDGIASLILENPYYGRRRPPGQHTKMLNRFSDLWAMGGAAVEEGRSVLRWLDGEGYRRLGVCGISMGGSMAAQAAALAGGPVAMVGCVTAHSASAVFTEGILRHYLAWDILDRELDRRGPEPGPPERPAPGREKGTPPLRRERREEGKEKGFGAGRSASPGAADEAEGGRAVVLMRELLDLTDIRGYPPPVRPDAAFLVAARHDAYIPPESAARVHAHWPGSTMRWLGTGHVGAFLFHRRAFLEAIRGAFSRL